MCLGKGGKPVPLEGSSLISWRNRSTCIPAWNAEQAAACLPTAMLAMVTCVKVKTPVQQARFVLVEECRSLSKTCL